MSVRKTTSSAMAVTLLAFTSVSGQARIALPDSGLAYSPDSSRVAFVKPTPGRTIGAGTGDVEATELWIAGRDGSDARRLVVGQRSNDMRFVLAGLHDPAFSADGQRVFFLSAAWVTSDAVHAVDLRGGKQRYVAAGNSLEVVRKGRYRGCLLVEQHRYWMAGGSYDWLWLLSASGREVGPVGDTAREDFASRVADWRATFAADSGVERSREETMRHSEC